jgi:ComF family protein
MVRTFARELLSLVVPPLCAACREPEFSGAELCPGCRSRLVALADPRCRRCGAPAPHETGRCRECAGRALAFERAWSPFAYEGVCREIVGALKSRGAVAVAAFVARELAVRAPPGMLCGTLVPVPAHARRNRRHGFNQAKAIAGGLGRHAGGRVQDVLARSGQSAPQVGLERRSRLANARASVRVKVGAAVPERAVLVDDVYTTGGTLDACARALLDCGAREVVAVTFARTVRA